MSRSSGRRAQVEPLAALAAVATVCLALSTYAGVVADVRPVERDRGVAAQTVEGALASLRSDGVVEPARLSDLGHAGPAGYTVAVTVAAGDRRWQSGPPAPARARSATRAVPVRVGDAVVPGRVRVEVWR